MPSHTMERIGQKEEQLGKGRHHKKDNEQVIEEKLDTKPTALVPETTLPADELCPEAEHTVAGLLQKQDRGLITNGS